MPDHARAEFPDRRLLNRWGRHWAIWFGCTSNCWANSASIFFPRTAASATFALKADCGFRRGRLLIVSPAPATMANFSQTTHLPRCADFPRHLSMFDRDVGVALAMQEELAREGGPAMARSTSLRGGRCRPRRRSGGKLPAGGSAHPRHRAAADRRRPTALEGVVGAGSGTFGLDPTPMRAAAAGGLGGQVVEGGVVQSVELGVEAARAHQLGVAAALDHPAVLEHDDPIGLADGG